MVDFIEFHIKNKLAIPCDINLKNQEEIFWKVHDKIIELDGTKEEKSKNLLMFGQMEFANISINM